MPFHHFTDNQAIPLAVSLTILLGSVVVFNENKPRRGVLLLFVGSLALGFFMANLDPFLILWDEQYHALVAKNMVTDPLMPLLYKTPALDYDYQNWTANHVWLHKQPLFLWQIALSLKLFGFNTLAVRLPSIIMHTLTALMIFRIGKLSVSASTGYYGALFFTVAWYPLELIAGRYATDHNDVAFLFYVTASLWALFEYYSSKRSFLPVLVGLFAGCALLVKWLPGLLVYGVWFLAIVINDRQNRLRIKAWYPVLLSLLVTLIVFIPWQVYIFLRFPLEAGYEYALNSKHFFEPIEGHGGNVWFHLHALNDLYGSGDAVPYILLLGLVILVRKTRLNAYRTIMVSSILIVYLFYSMAATKMTSFCLVVSPIVFLGLAALTDTGARYICSKFRYRLLQPVLTPVILVVVCFFLLNTSKIQNYHTDWKPHDNMGRKDDMEQLAFINRLKNLPGSEPWVIFNADIKVNGHIAVMFFTRHTAYNFIPTEDQIQQVKSENLRIAIRDNGTLPDYIRADKDIITVQ